jgi:hypothetical protein
MTTTLSTFNQLAQQAESLGLNPKVQPGDVFWVDNRILKRYTLSFRHMPDENNHAVVVLSVGSRNANIRVMTSKVQRYRRDGLLIMPMPEVALRRPGIILTRKPLRRRVPLTSLAQTKYLGNIGPGVLQRIRRHEQGLTLTDERPDEHPDVTGGKPAITPQRTASRREEQLVDRLLNSLRFKAA